MIAFHHTTVQLLFMAMQARQDIQMAVAFLTTRQVSRQEQLGEIKEGNEIPEWHEVSKAKHWCGEFGDSQMVC